MAEAFPYLGGQAVMYQQYLDAATGKMLRAEAGGGPYSMALIDGSAVVPPNDGRWGTAVSPPIVVPASAPALCISPRA